jgi:small-conductance mechanosensitive channel
VWHNKLELYIRSAVDFRLDIDSFARNRLLYKIPGDSALKTQYIERLKQVSASAGPIKEVLNKALIELSLLQNRVVKNRLEIQENIDDIRFYTNENATHLFSDEFQPIWVKSEFKRSFIEIAKFSFKKSWLSFQYYLANHFQVAIYFLAVWVLFSLFLKWNVRSIEKAGNAYKLDSAHFLITHPFTAVLFLTFSIAQFFFTDASLAFLQFLWSGMAVLGTILNWQKMDPSWRKLWLIFLVLFLMASIDNMVLQANSFERWAIVFIAAGGVAGAVVALKNTKKIALQQPMLIAFFWVFLAQEALSVIASITGTYTLGKIMMTGGYFNLLLAICLSWAIQLILQYIFVLSEGQQTSVKLSGYINLIRIQKNARPILNGIAFFGWMMIVAKNLYLYNPISENVGSFLTEKRMLGNFEFTIGSILIFFLVIYIASLLSRLVTFISNAKEDPSNKSTTTRLGSSILLIRIALISVGLLLAFAAAGIPMDRITIIIGSLSVGIGFGLQNIINNLVSGIIIAFEKPVNIGDHIEVGGKLGVVKEIGIRSSTLSTYDGSEVVIPNGDMLNQHLINWTKNSHKRRVEIIVGVRYGSNLQHAKQILESILAGHKLIDPQPKAAVLVHQFGSSSIDFRILFWTDVSVWVDLKSEVLLKVEEAFNKEGIEIPFPQQDIYIKEIPARKEEE